VCAASSNKNVEGLKLSGTEVLYAQSLVLRGQEVDTIGILTSSSSNNAVSTSISTVSYLNEKEKIRKSAFVAIFLVGLRKIMNNFIQDSQPTFPLLTPGYPEQGAEKLAIAEWIRVVVISV
jgi:hypothetical protein